MLGLKNLKQYRNAAWDVLRSPRTVAMLKLGVAVVGVIHALDELLGTSRVGKQRIGFRHDEEEE